MTPRLRVFDAHLHIIDPRFPLVPNEGYLPPPFTVAEYLRCAAPLAVAGGAVVSGSFQAVDQNYLLDALRQLGPTFVGVTQLPHTVGDDEVLALADAGVRAVRFNVRRGGSASLEHLDVLARRVYELAQWHVEVYVAGGDLFALLPSLRSLPAVSIDHLGLSAEALPALLQLVEGGARVKATGFGRYEGDIAAALRAIAGVNRAALLFGTDMPSTRAPRPFEDQDVTLLSEVLGEELTPAVLWDNAASFYRPRQLPPAP